MSDRRPWWKEAVVYQIYPRSFNDTNGDGIGDIPGIVEKVDYIDALGADAVWLNPVYASPNVDNGYDVSDYRAIMEEFGTMDDWERLAEALHDRDVKLIMDLPINHTSDEHHWFVESRESTDSEYRDYYFWREGDDGPSNDWESVWGGPAWTYDDATDEYYLHLFSEKQVDLDWSTPRVREELADVLEWWIDRGVDGFRLDAINLVSKPAGLPDSGSGDDRTGLNVAANGPRVAEYLTDLCERAIQSDDVVTIGEMPNLTVDGATSYVGDAGPLDMLFDFEHVDIDHGPGAWGEFTFREWKLPELKAIVERWQTGLEGRGWQGLYLTNHDQPRAVSRFGDDEEYRYESATMLATLLFTLRGTPFVYQGQEIGMTNPDFETVDELRDVATLRSVDHLVDSGEISGFEEIRERVDRRTRDNARTPMQWSDGENAGFTDGQPWIKVNDDYPEVNVEAARADPDSVWHYYRRLIDLRSEYETLIDGSFTLLEADHPRLFSYLRTGDDDRILVVLNVANERSTFRFPDSVTGESAELLVANRPTGTSTDGDEPSATRERHEHRSAAEYDDVTLEPYGARVYQFS